MSNRLYKSTDIIQQQRWKSRNPSWLKNTNHPEIENLDGYNQYFDDYSSIGSLAEVFINKYEGLVRKYYRIDGITITKKRPITNDLKEFEKFFNTEVEWSKKLKGDNVIKLHESGKIENGFYLVQEYGGLSLLRLYEEYDSQPLLHKRIPDIKEQIIELYKKFKKHNIYKINSAMCNLLYNDKGTIKAFDFKYVEPRNKQTKQWELHAINEWMSKIDPTLPAELKKLL